MHHGQRLRTACTRLSSSCPDGCVLHGLLATAEQEHMYVCFLRPLVLRCSLTAAAGHRASQDGLHISGRERWICSHAQRAPAAAYAGQERAWRHGLHGGAAGGHLCGVKRQSGHLDDVWGWHLPRRCDCGRTTVHLKCLLSKVLSLPLGLRLTDLSSHNATDILYLLQHTKSRCARAEPMHSMRRRGAAGGAARNPLHLRRRLPRHARHLPLARLRRSRRPGAALRWQRLVPAGHARVRLRHGLCRRWLRVLR